MTERYQGRRNADGSHQDDWNDHWTTFGEAAVGNPANDYRHAIVLKLLGDLPSGSTLLDIGCGQGQFALDYASRHPGVRVIGFEYSSEGVRRARESAERLGTEVEFHQRDLLTATGLAPDQPPATHAVCSEVLEHVENPVLLMTNARALLAPGARVVVTVPGGPRSAFDKHIGHFRHFTADALRDVLTDAGLEVRTVLRTGFPFFNLYKLAVIARGEHLVRDVARAESTAPSRLEALVTAGFRHAFRYNRDDTRFGWQLAAVAATPTEA